MPMRTFSQYLENVCMKICKKKVRTTPNLFNNWGKSKLSGKKTVPFLMRRCNMHSLVLHSGNGHMQKSTSCYLCCSPFTSLRQTGDFYSTLLHVNTQWQQFCVSGWVHDKRLVSLCYEWLRPRETLRGLSNQNRYQDSSQSLSDDLWQAGLHGFHLRWDLLNVPWWLKGRAICCFAYLSLLLLD